MKPIAFYAMLANELGTALRDHEGRVFFRTEATGLWTELGNADAGCLTLYGRVDIADAQLLKDGDKVYRTSKTLQARAA
jgi:hypothetical protein